MVLFRFSFLCSHIQTWVPTYIAPNKARQKFNAYNEKEPVSFHKISSFFFSILLSFLSTQLTPGGPGETCPVWSGVVARCCTVLT